jgi:hypothetical protein
MSKLLAGVIGLALSIIPSISSAATAYYTPWAGQIFFHNTDAVPLANATLTSQSGRLTNATAMLTISGTLKDDSEFPFAYTYLNLPVGYHFTGYTVQPRTSVGDLKFEYRVGSLLAPLQNGGVVVMPEPTAMALTACGAMGFVALHRRQRRWPQ